jgi:hypothetical protein
METLRTYVSKWYTLEIQIVARGRAIVLIFMLLSAHLVVLHLTKATSMLRISSEWFLKFRYLCITLKVIQSAPLSRQLVRL